MATTSIEIYKGTRNFWRQRINIDVNIFEHVDLKVVELIGFSADVHMEVRIYLSYPGLQAVIDLSKLESIVAEKKEENIRRKKAVVDAELRYEAISGIIVDYLLNRLSVVYDKEKSIFEVHLAALGADENQDLPIIPEPPGILVPAVVDRAQKNSRLVSQSTKNNCSISASNLISS